MSSHLELGCESKTESLTCFQQLVGAVTAQGHGPCSEGPGTRLNALCPFLSILNDFFLS